MEPQAPQFYIGHHETKRGLAVSPELVQHAQDLGVRASHLYTRARLTCESMT
jgi:hypothetical protein